MFYAMTNKSTDNLTLATSALLRAYRAGNQPTAAEWAFLGQAAQQHKRSTKAHNHGVNALLMNQPLRPL
jgi:hypothetical protein